MKNEIDILIFGGQSNMAGETESLPEKNVSFENVWEYRALSDELIPLVHPSGEDIGEGLLNAATAGHGSLLPDFCRTYALKTGHSVTAISVARGGTKISEWLKGTERYECTVKKILSGIKKVSEKGSIGKIFYVWLQGESDAFGGTSAEDYLRMLTEYKNDLKADVGFEKFCIIEVGYFCDTVSWLPENTAEDDERIMRAQQQAAAEDKDFVMLTQICSKISRNPEYINPFVEGHYNNKGMTLIGTEAASKLATLI